MTHPQSAINSVKICIDLASKTVALFHSEKSLPHNRQNCFVEDEFY